jgi:MYND finger
MTWEYSWNTRLMEYSCASNAKCAQMKSVAAERTGGNAGVQAIAAQPALLGGAIKVVTGAASAGCPAADTASELLRLRSVLMRVRDGQRLDPDPMSGRSAAHWLTDLRSRLRGDDNARRRESQLRGCLKEVLQSARASARGGVPKATACSKCRPAVCCSAACQRACWDRHKRWAVK